MTITITNIYFSNVIKQYLNAKNMYSYIIILILQVL
jgi:hypothetical protein